MRAEEHKKDAEAAADAWIEVIAVKLRSKLSRPEIKFARAGRRYVSEYSGALYDRDPEGGKKLVAILEGSKRVEIEPASITINLDAIELNPWDRIELSIGHELIHHYLFKNDIDAATHGHGAAFKTAARKCAIPCRGRYASLPPAKLPPAKNTRDLYRCRCPKGPRIRSGRPLNARCLDCKAKFRKVEPRS